MEWRVTHIQMDENGDITGLANPDEWGCISSTGAIFHISHNMHHYYVAEEEYKSYIHVKRKNHRNVLSTYEDKESANNLYNLPTLE